MATFVYEINEPTQVYDDLDEKKVNHFLISERTSKFIEKNLGHPGETPESGKTGGAAFNSYFQ